MKSLPRHEVVKIRCGRVVFAEGDSSEMDYLIDHDGYLRLNRIRIALRNGGESVGLMSDCAALFEDRAWHMSPKEAARLIAHGACGVTVPEENKLLFVQEHPGLFLQAMSESKDE